MSEVSVNYLTSSNSAVVFKRIAKSSDCVISLWCIYCIAEIVSNKAKGWISKRVFQENKAPQIFRKTNISYPLIHAHTCAYQGVRNVCFSENLTFVFFWNSCFEICPFALLPTKWRFYLGRSSLTVMEWWPQG